MPRAVVEIESVRTPAEVLAYMSDFSRAPEWDPSVVRARRLDEGAITTGSRFELTVRAAGRTTDLEYVVESLGPTSVVLLSHSSRLESRDTITVEPRPDGTLLRYDARLEARGWSRVTTPLLALVFRRLASNAAAGLRARLGRDGAVGG